MAYSSITDPSAFFQTVIYTGNATARSITFDGNSDMQPDWIWGKQRSGTDSHQLTDVVRGVTKILNSDTTAAENTTSAAITAFGSDGFSLGTGGGYNGNNVTQVAWNWKAGTSFSNSSGANNATIASTGSINTDAGFSIISWTGDGNNGAKIAHGLGATPAIVITKRRDDTGDWQTGGSTIDTARGGANSLLLLNTTAVMDSNSEVYQTFSSTTFQVGVNAFINTNNATMISYCFKNVQGYSKSGSYKGNNNANGTFVYTGFKPAFVMIKLIDTQTDGWVIQDNKRDISNTGTSTRLRANTGGAEFTSTNEIDFLSNGFKPRGDDGEINGNGSKHIYIAFAESPLVTSTGVPATAR